MIKSKKDYLEFLESDRIALNVQDNFKNYFFNEIWKFQRLLRKFEYYKNCKKNSILILITEYRFRQLSIRLGYSIEPNTFGKGLSIAHRGTIVVNNKCKIGENCRIHVCVNIGEYKGKAPLIGNNCYIGPGAKIYGDIKIGDNVIIGANSVVNKTFGNNVVIAGVPAVIKKR